MKLSGIINFFKKIHSKITNFLKLSRSKFPKILSGILFVSTNLALILVDFIIILAFLICLFAVMIISIFILLKLTNIEWKCFFDFCKCLRDRYPGSDFGLISILGVCLSGVLLPIISIIITSFLSNKSLNANLANSLAEAKNIQLNLIKLHEGEWNELSNAFYKDVYCLNRKYSELNLSEFNYCLNLCFDGKVFQNYKLLLREIGFVDVQRKNIKIRNEKNYLHIPYVISDDTGVIGKYKYKGKDKDKDKDFNVNVNVNENFNAGTNINILFKESTVTNFIKLEKPYLAGANIYFEVRFIPNQDSYFVRFRQLHKCVALLPIIKGIYQFFVWAKMRYSYQKICLWINGRNYLDKDRNVSKYNIYDVDIESVRGNNWSFKFVSGNKKSKTKISKNSTPKDVEPEGETPKNEMPEVEAAKDVISEAETPKDEMPEVKTPKDGKVRNKCNKRNQKSNEFRKK